MCDIRKGFKLCTCNEVDESSSHWKLLRLGEEIHIIIGTPVFDTEYTLLNYDFIESDLNARNCFDFDYTPQNDDRLMIYLKSTDEDLTLCYDFKIDEYHKGWCFIDMYENKGAHIINQGKITTA